MRRAVEIELLHPGPARPRWHPLAASTHSLPRSSTSYTHTASACSAPLCSPITNTWRAHAHARAHVCAHSHAHSHARAHSHAHTHRPFLRPRPRPRPRPQVIFYLIFAIVTAILLLNLFIAMLADTYTRVSTQAMARRRFEGGGECRGRHW